MYTVYISSPLCTKAYRTCARDALSLSLYCSCFPLSPFLPLGSLARSLWFSPFFPLPHTLLKKVSWFCCSVVVYRVLYTECLECLDRYVSSVGVVCQCGMGQNNRASCMIYVSHTHTQALVYIMDTGRHSTVP